jgi:hypothetical protein
VTNDSHSDSIESDSGRNSRVSAVKEAGGLLAEAEVRLDAIFFNLILNALRLMMTILHVISLQLVSPCRLRANQI